MTDKPKTKRGFAAMSPELRSKLASMGGKASGGNFARDPKRAVELGRKGGLARPCKVYGSTSSPTPGSSTLTPPEG